MIRSPRRSAGRSRAVLVALVAVGGVTLAGCGAGQQAQTAEQRPTIDGTNAQAGSLALRGIAIQYPEGGVHVQGSDARLRLVLVNEGRQPDALVEVRTDAAEDVTFAPAGQPGEGTAASPTPEPTATATPSATASGATASGSPSGTATASGEASASATGSPTTGAPTASPTEEATEEATSRVEIPPAALVSFRDTGAEITLVGLTRALRAAEVVPITFVFENAGEVTVDVSVAVPEEEVSLAPTVPHEGEA